ncbi:hypothetical protein [Streptomyces incarnatus]|nr:hypothetical protein [Streptomyces incarnatus]
MQNVEGTAPYVPQWRLAAHHGIKSRPGPRRSGLGGGDGLACWRDAE